MRGLNVFEWRDGQPSTFMVDPAFNGRNTGLSTRATATKELTPVTLPGSINTELMRPTDKSAKIRRGALSEQRRAV